jgi:hypothetical protein
MGLSTTRQESVGPLVKDEGALCSHSAYSLQPCLEPAAQLGSPPAASRVYYDSFFFFFLILELF